MRTALLLLLLPLVGTVTAQVTITEADMPNAGDTLRFKRADPTQVPLGITGEDVVWDLGDLGPLSEGADTAVAVGSTPFLYQLFFNNPFLFPAHRADYGVVGAEFDLLVLSLTEVYDYFRADADGFFNVGFGANVNGLPTSVRREPVDRIHSFPLQFGSTDVSPSAFNVTVPTMLYFGQDQVRTTVVDGWGTLVLPNGTYDVLRVKSTLQRTDTIFIEQFGVGFRLPEPETVEYRWLAPGMGKPVLEVVTTAGIPVSAEYFHAPEDLSTGIGAAHGDGLTVFPNPCSTDLVIPANENGRIVLRDQMGRAVREANVRGGMLERLDVSGLAEGAYLLEHIGASGTLKTTTVVVQH